MTLSGSFADREHRKWVEEAVVLPNNPYTTENIVRRSVLPCYDQTIRTYTTENTIPVDIHE